MSMHTRADASLIQMGWCKAFLGFSPSGQIIANVWSSSNITISALGPQIQTTPFWTHIVQTWSSTNGLRLYINNYLYTSVSNATTYLGSGSQNYATLGTVLNGTSCSAGQIQSTSQYFGDIDDFRIFSRELTSTDICELANL
ncbi:unnamed protein product [Didymodactylos carnosus]|uniref:LamG domain-containing protein n=1 Tax=Didymodactylos carnosus TaxID=1234261 RepID=A0A816D9X6_9BILA|nr:unnamed protein product [Didymodactylos carnosus]CAF4531984.1 unnamed protein product [Didymodactylos carnosus]